MATGSTNVFVSFFLNVKSRLDLLDLLAPFLGAYCIRSEPADFFLYQRPSCSGSMFFR